MDDLVNEDSSGWTDEELRESVRAYLEMQEHVRSGTPFVKKSYYEALAARLGGRRRRSNIGCRTSRTCSLCSAANGCLA